ncbi:JmjC domain, hydroxylase-domain-containing protein, partial [Phakopsora pachyrhizi]
IEQEYWRTIGNGGEPIYGADTTGSLFDERTEHWNVANLDNLLNRLKLKKKIPGVNSPYLYFGTWRATYAWHVEDADLYSINYIHFGAPKFWYSVPQEHNQRFESFMSSSFAKERMVCPEFLRHKAFLASPSVLQSVGIQLNKVIHLPGEIILTYPYGYHSGFNLGYNCAESVNFANEKWIEKGRKARFCKCIDDA